jgi:hypothetical protein
MYFTRDPKLAKLEFKLLPCINEELNMDDY